MEFVIKILQENIAMDEDDAIKTMLEIHFKGGIILSLNSYQQAQDLAKEITTQSTYENHQLICRTIKARAKTISEQ